MQIFDDNICNALEEFLRIIMDMRDSNNMTGFCHNDLHSGNVVYNIDENKFYLIDFGLAYADIVDSDFTNTDDQIIINNIIHKIKSYFGDTNLNINSIQLFPQNMFISSFGYKSITKETYNLWADFAGLIKSLINKGILTRFLQTKFGTNTDAMERSYPMIMSSLSWYYVYQDLFLKFFKGEPLEYNEGTVLILYNMHYIHFINKCDHNPSIKEYFTEKFDKRVQPQPGGRMRRVLKMKGGANSSGTKPLLQNTKDQPITSIQSESWETIFKNKRNIEEKQKKWLVKNNVPINFEDIDIDIDFNKSYSYNYFT